jgi:hypothetical protein
MNVYWDHLNLLTHQTNELTITLSHVVVQLAGEMLPQDTRV